MFIELHVERILQMLYFQGRGVRINRRIHSALLVSVQCQAQRVLCLCHPRRNIRWKYVFNLFIDDIDMFQLLLLFVTLFHIH